LIRDDAGLPLPGLLVRAGPLLWPVAKTDAAGVIELPLAKETTIHLLVLDEQGHRHSIALPPWVDVVANPVIGDQVITVPPVPWVQGRVLEATSRRPVVDALVWTGLEPGSASLT